MTIRLNGESVEIPGPLTVAALLVHLGIDARRVAVEHNLSVVTTLCDKLLVLNAGSIIAEGRPEEVIKDRNVREAFLGS